VEICGVVVGKWARDADGPYVLISEAIRGEAATNKFAEVTFTHETWARINAEMDTKFQGLAIVGWYHSHPGFGVFLSDRDRFIQEHFFSGPGQLAYVVDPVRKTEGVFAWHEGKPTLAPHYWVGDRVQVGTPAGREEETSPASLPGAAAPGPAPARGGTDWLPLLSQAALGLLLFLLGFLLAGKMSEFERRQIEERAGQQAFGRWAFLKFRPGLREELDRTLKDLLAAAESTKVLATEHLKLVDKPKEAEAEWNKEVFAPLSRLAGQLLKIQDRYCLTPEEEKTLDSLGVGKPKSEAESKSPAKDKAADKDKKPKPDAKPPAKEKK
jgi:proteasome lid subunit RPN8/RPN11